MVTSHSRPGVEVVQELRNVSPTIFRPILLPAVVGPCYEIISLMDSSGAVNSSAQLTLPARIVGDAAGPDLVFTSSNTAVKVSVGGAASQTYTLPEGSYTLTLAASYLNNNLTGLTFSVDSGGTIMTVETSAKGENQTVEFEAVSNDAYTKLGIKEYEAVVIRGMSAYENRRARTSFSSFPVDKGTIGELDYVEDDIRLWLLQGGQARELATDEAVLCTRWGRNNTRANEFGTFDSGSLTTFPTTKYAHTLIARDDGDGDGVTKTFYAAGANASITVGDLTIEAKGNQDTANEGPYHGDIGNSISALVKPGGGATSTLQNAKVKVTALATELYPDILISLTSTVAGVAVGDTISGEDSEGTTLWTAVVNTVVSGSGGPGAYTFTIYNLSSYSALMGMNVGDVITDGAWTSSGAITATGSTTVAQMAAAIDSAAANLLATSYESADAANAFFDTSPASADPYRLEPAAAPDTNEFKPGDYLYPTDEVDVYVTDVSGTPAAGDVVVSSGTADWAGEATVLDATDLTSNNWKLRLHRLTDWINADGFIHGGTDMEKKTPGWDSGIWGLTASVTMTGLSSAPAAGDVITNSNNGFVIGAYVVSATMTSGSTCDMVLGAIADWPGLIAGGDTDITDGVWGTGAIAAGNPVVHSSMFTKTCLVTDVDNATDDEIIVRATSGTDKHFYSPAAATDLYVYKANDLTIPLAIAASGATNDFTVAHQLSGGRDPQEFAAAATAPTAESTLPIANDATKNYTATYIGLTGSGTSFTVGNFVTFGTIGSSASGKVLGKGDGYITVGLNDGDSNGDTAEPAGDVYWPQTTDTITEYTNAGVATGITGAVSECHFTAAFSSVGLMKTGDTLTFTDTNTNIWTADVVSVTAVGVAYQVVLTDLVRTTVGTTAAHSVPQSGATVTGVAGCTLTSDLLPKLVPTSGGILTLSINGGDEVEVELEGYETPAQVVTAIHTAISGTNFMSAGASFVIDGANVTDTPFTWRSNTGLESEFYIKSGLGTILFGEDLNTKVTGGPFPVAKGDELYNGSTLLGTVSKAPSVLNIGGQSFPDCLLTLDTDSATPATEYTSWYVMAQNLPEGYAADSTEYLTGDSADRPFPELSVITALQDIQIRHDVARNFDGTPVDDPAYALYVSYSALRLDIAPGGDREIQLQIIEDATDLNNKLGPISPDNPLAWGVYRTLLNMPDMACAALGVGATSADQSEGTTTAYTSAAEFLESESVYMITPLSQDRTVQQMWMAHVETMSEPENKHERILFINRELPEELEPTLVGSGTAETDVTNTIEFDSADINVTEKLLAAGLDPTWSADDFLAAGVYLDIASDAKVYSVSNVNGQKVSVQVIFSPGENDDDFYAEADMPTLTAGGELVAIYQRGDDVESNLEICSTLAEQGAAIGERRVRFVMPDIVLGEYNGVQQEEEGYYGACAIMGQRVIYGPSQPLKNLKIIGLTGVKNSSDRFSERNMAVAAAGGIWWLVQDVEGGPVVTRDALTTDMSSIESREDSIGTALDYLAIMYRTQAKQFIGNRNITPGLLDTLALALEGVGHFAMVNDICDGAPTINNIIQDEDQPDTILVDITVRPLYPCNLIRITLVV